MKNCACQAAMLFVLAVALPFFGAAQNSKIAFFDNDLEAAKAEAAASGKLILIKFSARWCLPCRVMDEHVWPAADLAEAVAASCAAVAVDVEHFDGVGLRQLFEVEKLPTIVLLDACGERLGRLEGAATASQILDEIRSAKPVRDRFFDRPENRFCQPGQSFAEAEKPALEVEIVFLSQPVSRPVEVFFSGETVASVEPFSMPFDLPMH